MIYHKSTAQAANKVRSSNAGKPLRLHTTENIFGYPLAMLFYRMANKLIRNTPVIPEKKAKQRTLFMKCCDLLDEVRNQFVLH